MLPLKKSNRGKYFPLLFLLFLPVIVFGFFSGCATAPGQKPASTLIDFLPDEETVYLKLDIQSNNELLEALLSGDDGLNGMVGKAMERTEVVLLSFRLPNEGNREFFLVASGSYPKGVIESSLKKDKSWKREKQEFIFWKNDEMGLQLYFPEKNIIAISNGHIKKIFDRVSEDRRYLLPTELRHEMDISDVVFYMPDPGKDLISAVGGGAKTYPIKMIWVTLDSGKEEEKKYTMDVVVLMDDVENAEKFGKVAKLLIAALMMKEGVGDLAALRQNMKVLLDGSNVRLQDIPLASDDLSRFFVKTLAGPRE